MFSGLACVFSSWSIGIDYTIKQLSIEQGLPGENVQCAFQDSKGIMWFGIESVGLCKYDGKKFTVYQNSPKDEYSISNNFPKCIAEDKEGYIWVGTDNGLNQYNRISGKFKRFFHSDDSVNSIHNNVIWDILVDEYDNIWLATQASISKYTKHNNLFNNLLIGEDTLTDGLPAIVYSLYMDENRNIWIGSYSSGLFLIDAETNRKHTRELIENPENAKTGSTLKITRHWLPLLNIKGEQENYAIQDICGYKENSLLIGKINGLFTFNITSETFSRYILDRDSWLTSAGYTSLLKDSRNMIWAGTVTNGLLVINMKDDSHTYLDANNFRPEGLKSNNIRYLFEDKSGLVWICTKFEGIQTYDKRQEIFKEHPYNQLLGEKVQKVFALSILEDKVNLIWLGTKDDGLYKFDPGTGVIENFKNSNSKLSSNRIGCLAEDNRGNIWIGTDRGVNRLRKNNMQIKRYEELFIRCISTDEKDNVWIGSNSTGLYYIDAKNDKFARFTATRHKTFFNNATNGIQAITFTSDSLMWIATNQNGLYKYNIQKDQLSHYLNNPQDNSSISGNMVRAIYKDYEENIWITTKSEGLNKYDSNNDKFIRMQNLYPSMPNTVYSMLQDTKGNFWMGSHEGLMKFDLQNNNFIVYYESDGLKSNIFEINAKCKTSEGLMIFGGSNGINFFDPEEVSRTEYFGKLIISSIKIYDKIIAEDISDYGEYKISYKDKFFSIEFAYTEYNDPTQISYKYILENFDNDWIESGNRNYASYTSLPPGEYLFKVLATNSKKIWMDVPLKIKITITSPFWRKPVFIITSIVFLVLLAIVIYILRIRFIRRNEIRLKQLVEMQTEDLMKANIELETHRLHLEKLVKERTKDLEEARKKAENSDKLKSVFLANMSHEIRTPLNAIIGLSNMLITQDVNDEESDDLKDLIESNGDALLQLINDIIDISKIEADQIKIFKEAFSINECITNITEIYQKQVDLYKNQINVKVLVDIPARERKIITDKIRIEQILKNLINNAIKFTKEGSITVGYTIEKNKNKQEFIRFFVKDTGIGIPENELKTIFDRFIKNESKENILYGGTGLGLSISSNLARLLGGAMWVESKLNKGSTFYFEIPLEQAEEYKPEKQPKIEEHKEHNWKDKTVLIAENERANFLVLRGILKFTNIHIIHVKDGQLAVDMVTKNSEKKIDIVLMDIKMPRLDGIEAAKKIKEYDQTIPIIAQTAYAMDYEEKMIVKAGFDGYIAKPIVSKLLIEKMAVFLG